VIIPVFANPELMEPCLSAIRQSSFQDFEILVADDASLDEAAIQEAAARHNARVVRLRRNSGPATARNTAAREASGEILVFLDSDVTVHHDTLARIAAAFESDPALGAVMGSYDLQPHVHGTVATFRNLLHAHVHHRSSREATTFWAGCGGVRRSLFRDLGGFDESYPRPSIEDVEFGMRLHRAGGKLALDPGIQVTHRKQWTLASMFYADTLLRAMPWTALMLRHGLPGDLNFRWQDRLSLLLGTAFPALAFLALRFGRGWWPIAGATVAAVGLLQWPLFSFLKRAGGFAFSVLCFPLYFVHLWSAACGFMAGLWRWEISRDRWFPAAAGTLAVLIFGGIQAAGGAYTAEFDAFPDEPAHFMTGLMIRDYLAQWPRGSPLAWAGQYYLHYPKVALGHWPPLFHLTEGVWWLFAPPSRVTGMLLVGLLGWIAAVLFYRIARTIAHPLAALLAAGLLVATPVFQQSAAQQMTELLTLVFGLLQMNALVRFLQSGSQRALAEAGLWCGLCLLTHGTGACLVLAPLLALLPDGRWRRVRVRYWVWFAIWVSAGLLWYPFQSSSSTTADSAGIGTSIPWGFNLLLALAGPGVAVLAALGALTLVRSREPVTVAAAAMLVSLAATSWFLRAMREPRHFILALPALLLLSMAFARFVWTALPSPGRAVAVAVCAAAALAFFPWSRYQQKPAGYAGLAQHIRQPARMLVSSPHGWEEGSWVVLASLRETRPASVIMRATKVLARVNWNGGNYLLLADSPAKVAAALDRLGVETVVLDEHIATPALFPHDKLLRETLAASVGWKQCATSGSLFAWCRVQPPAPRTTATAR
jgi:GT2 family glycosyltransferase